MGVPSRDTVEAMRDFVERHGLQDIPQAADVEGRVWAANEVIGQPAWVFIDGDSGSTATVTSHLGALGGEGLAQRIDELLAG